MLKGSQILSFDVLHIDINIIYVPISGYTLIVLFVILVRNNFAGSSLRLGRYKILLSKKLQKKAIVSIPTANF